MNSLVSHKNAQMSNSSNNKFKILQVALLDVVINSVGNCISKAIQNGVKDKTMAGKLKICDGEKEKQDWFKTGLKIAVRITIETSLYLSRGQLAQWESVRFQIQRSKFDSARGCCSR